MPTSLGEEPKDYGLGWIGIVGVFVVPVMVVTALVAVLIMNPRAATHFSNAIETELGFAQVEPPGQSPPSVTAAFKAK
jgi:hypothetical protein